MMKEEFNSGSRACQALTVLVGRHRLADRADELLLERADWYAGRLDPGALRGAGRKPFGAELECVPAALGGNYPAHHAFGLRMFVQKENDLGVRRAAQANPGVETRR